MVSERKNSDYLWLILLHKQFNFTVLESERGRVHLKKCHMSPGRLCCFRGPLRGWASGRTAVPPAYHGGPARVDGEKRLKKNDVVSLSQGILWSARGSPGSCPSQKPAPGHHHRDPAGNSVLHPHERVLLHCNVCDRAPAVTGGGCGECPGLCGRGSAVFCGKGTGQLLMLELKHTHRRGGQ